MLEQIESLHSENPKEYWNLIDKLKDENRSNPCENISSDDWLLHFKSLGQVEDRFKVRVDQLKTLVEQLEKQPVYTNLDNTIKLSEVCKSICKLKSNKAAGLDSICNEMLKCSQNALGPCYLKIFNACLSNGLYPNCWCEGYITPLHKSDDPYNPANYRGISIISDVGKNLIVF